MLRANPNYWAGPPAVTNIELVTDIAGQSPVELFESGALDYTSIFDADATWVAYDPTLGPQLREVPALSTDYYGFDTSKPPFDDVRVRQAFAMAVDWRRIARLAATDPDAPPVTSMVPPGIPGRSDKDFLPVHDPAKARSLLAEAGYPGGAGFPPTTFMTGGGGADAAVIEEIRRELGVELDYETMDFNDYYQRLADDPPAMWSLGWIADYPGRNDFLGVLLETGSTNDYGHWSSAEFDAAIAEAGAATDPAAATAAYDRAESILDAGRAGHPGRLRDRLGALPGRAARGERERPRDRPDGGAGMGRLMRLGAVLPAVVLVAAVASWAVAPVAAAADVATFGTPTVEGSFGQDITFRQPVTIDATVGSRRAAGHVRGRARADGRSRYPRRPTGATTLTYTMKIADQGHILPNTPMTASWRLTPHADPSAPAIGPSVKHVYADEGHAWKTTAGKIVRVHWYEGSEAFGKRALEIGESAIEESAALLGVTETEPVDFFIYADEDSFRAALGPGTRENVGGQADAEIRTLFALIPAAQIDDAWVKAVVPHELTHLVFDTAADNPYHFPPRWLNEGVAVYESEGYGPSDRSDVASGRERRLAHPAPRADRAVPDERRRASASPTRRACRPSTS